jgi:hypothetical protein
MKKSFFILNALALIAFAIVACKKNEANIPYTLVSGQGLLKINFESGYTTNPPYQIKINDQRVSYNLTARTPFPGGGLNTGGGSTPDYLSVAPGTATVSFSIPKFGTNTDSVALYSTTVALEADKYYTLHVTDTGAKTQSVLVTEDVANRPDSGYSKYRFVNLMPNVAAVDLYFGSTIVAANIPYKGVSPFFTLAFTNANAWAVRPAGAAATSTALATYSTGSVPNQRIFTVFAIGYSGSTDAIRKPYVSLFYNR